MARHKKYQPLALGETFQLNFSEIEDYNGDVLTDLSGITFESVLKEDIADTDVEAVAEYTQSDTELTIDGGTLKAQICPADVSETLTPGTNYIFSIWMKESDQPSRIMKLGTYIGFDRTEKDYISGKFRAITPINKTKNLT